jgi:hypothetical protein
MKHDVSVLLLAAVFMAFAMISAAVWLIELTAVHAAILAGIALIIGAACHFGRRDRRRARPGQVQPPRGRPEQPTAAALPVATLPLAADWDELGTRQPAPLQAGSDRDSFIATPMSGARPLWGPS